MPLAPLANPWQRVDVKEAFEASLCCHFSFELLIWIFLAVCDAVLRLFTWCLPDSPKLGFRVRVSVSPNWVSANRD